MASHDLPLAASQLSLAQLNERSREIFRLIVESYLATGEPVGSRNLSRILPMTLSPASVRNVMSDLEQLGLVYAPHTSAGRLPTEIGPVSYTHLDVYKRQYHNWSARNPGNSRKRHARHEPRSEPYAATRGALHDRCKCSVSKRSEHSNS